MKLFEVYRTLGRGVFVKPEFVAVAGDLAAGTLLSQIIYWNLPDKLGKSKLKVYRGGRAWIAKTSDEWCGECSLTEKQFRRVVRRLEAIGLIERDVMQFHGQPMTHISLNEDAVLSALHVHLSETHQKDISKSDLIHCQETA